MFNYDTAGDTADVAKLEGVRQLNDIYHYLLSQGVVGRWVHVYRPTVEGDDPTMWFERLSGDARRGIIVPKHAPAGAVTVKPKGLLAGERYVVSYQESDASEERTGADLMERGIAVLKMPPGESIYLNLPLHPGNTVDKQPPTPPSDLHVAAAENMGYPGVELTWKPGADETWVSYYEIFRGGTAINKVAKGTYYFDHSPGADARVAYEVRTVDGAGNVSETAVSPVSAGKSAVVFDDADLTLIGTWQRTTHVQPAHAGTICESDRKADSAELTFEGKRVMVIVKLGPKGGKAAVSFEGAGGAGETFDTFSADEIWGVGIYRHAFAATGKHTMRVTVLGEHHERSEGNGVALDGVRVEQE